MPLRIVNRTSGILVADRAEIANTNTKRIRGLLERSYIRAREGLWIVPCGSVHTVGMKFPIDVLFIDHAGQVVLIATLKPGCKHLSHERAYSVLELAPGEAAARGIELGDVLAFQRR